ncbi:MAG: ribonuclease III [Nitrospiraceae bacterium]
MNAAVSTDVVQQALGYRFRQPHLLDEALTHKSHVNERKGTERKHNERLEFLGDAVLALVISDYLASSLPHCSEGELSKLKARLVSETSLVKAARRIGLGGLLHLGRGEELTKGREKNSLLADALEALIAAVYLDGGLEAGRAFTLRMLAEELQEVDPQNGRQSTDDHKTQLQEWCQKRFETLPQYVIVRESGPDHQKLFEVELSICGDVVGVGRGHSKKEAEQRAAKQALDQIHTK